MSDSLKLDQKLAVENQKKFSALRYNDIAIVGLGYVGLPICIEFAKKYNCMGYDVDAKKIDLLNKKIRPIEDITQDDLDQSKAKFSMSLDKIKRSSVYIVTVPTPG